MRTLIRRVVGGAITCVTFLAAFALVATPALAAATSVTVSGSSPSGAVTATASSPTATDISTGTKITCASATLAGTVANGTTTGSPPIVFGAVNTVAWNTCKISSITVSLAAAALPWPIAVTGPTDPSGHTPIRIVVVIKLTGPCSATITGTLTGYYDNNNHTIVITGGVLTVSGVSGLCLGLINNGDSVTFTAIYAVTPVTLTITAA